MPRLEILAVLKMKALGERMASPKGRKDLINLLSLFKFVEFDFANLTEIVAEYSLGNLLATAEKLIEQTTAVRELGLNPHVMSRVKKRILGQLQAK